MKAPTLSSLRWLGAAASWRPAASDRLELWLPREWPSADAELRWRRTEGGASRQGSQRGLEGLAAADEVVVWTPAAETLLLRSEERRVGKEGRCGCARDDETRKGTRGGVSKMT